MTWRDHLGNVAEAMLDITEWLRDPHSWSRPWRRIALLTLPAAIVIWLVSLVFLVGTGVGMDLFVRLANWIDLNLVSFDDWWNREDAVSPS